MTIPTISPLSINTTELDALLNIGFCYVKLPDANLTETIKTCIQVARRFFLSEKGEKEKWQLKETLTADDRYEGYTFRSQSKNTHAIEQIFFEPDAPLGPYQNYAAHIQAINTTFKDLIFFPLLSAIFEKLQLAAADLVETVTQPNSSLVFQSCPRISDDKNIIRLNAHKDFGLLTIVFFEEPGLEVKYLNDWLAIPPQKDCVVVNLGNALELMTGQRCHSALHRVSNATDNRISMVYFFNPAAKQQVRNYVDKTVIAPSGEQFFKEQFTAFYDLDH